MKYFSLQTVENAYKGISAKTNNKFWGIIDITSSVGSMVVPQKVYSLDINNVSNLLENQFCLAEQVKVYNRDYKWNVIFSNSWAEYVADKLLHFSPNIYDVLVWYFRREKFDDNITKQQLVARFLECTNISVNVAKRIFVYDDKDIDFAPAKYSEAELLTKLNKVCDNKSAYTTITAEKSFVASNAGELSRAPFVQTLYAGQGVQECMILTQFDFHEYYGNVLSKKSPEKEKSTERLLFQSNDKNAFVWECIKHFNKNKELRPLFTSKYKGIGGSMGNYILINGCYVAQRDSDSNYDNIYVEGEGYIHNSFDARDIEKFAFAINDIYADSYKIVIDGNGQNKIYKLIKLQAQNIDIVSEYTPYLTALRTKPFMLLAGISGTGKSRIAREIAKACWPVGSEQREKQVPDNFCMVQVKPNWHDSTELLGYVSRIGGENKEKYISGDLLPFITKAWENPSVPYILCLDEMNLAPVEQYFAEYLSVIESRRMDNSGHITTDPILKKNGGDWYRLFTNELTDDDNLRVKFLEEGISIPQNLFVVGTVNMDETTFSFSRKVLDRAMTIEMNKVDLWSSLSEKPEGDLGYIGNILLSNAAKGTDVYIAHQALCDEAVKYLEKVNNILEGTPFKIAYRTRNEFMLYAVSREVIEKDSPLWKSLDEMTSMKILSRIEGDDERCKAVLNGLFNLLNDEFADNVEESVSIKKVNEMLDKLKKTGYTSYWT